MTTLQFLINLRECRPGPDVVPHTDDDEEWAPVAEQRVGASQHLLRGGMSAAQRQHNRTLGALVVHCRHLLQQL